MTPRDFIGALLTTTAAGALLSALAAPALAQSVTPLPPVAVDTTPGLTSPLSSSSLGGEGLATGRLATSDTVRMLEDLLGVDSAANGGISSLPSIHGLADDRLNIEVDGKHITSACSNHMNPALSYTAPAQVGKATVWAGITPVSVGGDSIGGTIAIDSPAPVFALPGESLHKEGSVTSFYRSNSHAIGGSATGTLATDRYSMTYTGGVTRAGDYKDGNGNKIGASRYETINHGGTLAMRRDGDVFTLQAGQNWIPYQGFPNAAMDMNYNKSNYANGRYQGEFNWGSLDAKIYWQSVEHKMNYLNDSAYKSAMGPGTMEMDTKATDMGYSVKAELPLNARDTVRIGNEFHHYEIKDWWPPVMGMMMGPNSADQLNNATRDRLGTFAEWEAKWTPEWTTLLGGRIDGVWTNTGAVQDYGGATADATAFNALNHAKSFVDFDLTALARYEPSKTNTNEIGYARKTRAPNLYELYDWHTTNGSNMIGWFGDFNNYAGNINLKPEVAHTLSLSASLHDEGSKSWNIKVTPYYTYVQDYINVKEIPTVNGFASLQFINHDAEIYGIDVSGKANIWDGPAYGRGDIKGSLGWMHGQTTSGDALYHMMPLNGKLALEHALGGWTSAVEVQLVNRKSEADPLRREPFTAGYTLFNLRTGSQWQSIRFDVGIENLLNRHYYLPLGGVNFADTPHTSSATIGALPGPGRSYNAALTVKF